jgi:hypothetical protein
MSTLPHALLALFLLLDELALAGSSPVYGGGGPCEAWWRGRQAIDEGGTTDIPARETAPPGVEPAGGDPLGLPSRPTSERTALPTAAPGWTLCSRLLSCGGKAGGGGRWRASRPAGADAPRLQEG